jgi:hypothetical protein
MRSGFNRSLVLITAAVVLSASTQTAHASDERHRPRVGSAAPFKEAMAPDSPRLARLLAQPQADPVSNGIGIGAAIGAATGLGFMAWAYAQCNDTCDAPEPVPMYLMAGGFGAAVGGVVGWLIDANRKSTNQRVTLTGIATPRKTQVRVGVGW